LAACIRARLLCLVASERAEKPPQHIIDAMSSIAAGVRNARYFPGGSDFAGRDMYASWPRASSILEANAFASHAKPERPDFTALSARW